MALSSIAVASWGCGDGGRVLSSAEAKHLLLQLPYQYRWRQVEPPEGAIAGTAIGKHRTIGHFGISLGEKPQPVPVPQVGSPAQGYGGGSGFVITNDLEVPGKNETVHPGKQFHTAAQWNEAGTMVVELEEKLCKATTGKPCPV